MKRSVRSLLLYVVALVTVAGIGTGLSMLAPPSAEAATGFTLGPGSYVGDVPEATDYRDLVDCFSLITLDVSADGAFSASAQHTVSEGPSDGGYVHVATYDLSIDGSYDFASGIFSGTVNIQGKFDRTQHIPEFTSQYHQVGEHTFQGTISGQANPGDTVVNLAFTGKDVNSITLYISQNGVDNPPSSNSFDTAYSVDFPVRGTIPALEGTTESTLQDGDKSSSVAAFSGIWGQVEVNIPNPDGTYEEENWAFAKYDMVLPPGTHIKTSERSGVVLSFLDMTTFTMKPESEIILTNPAQKDSQIELLLGSLYTNAKKMLKDGSMDIEMSQAVCGIKGTRFLLTEDGSESTVTVTEGTVAFTSRATGETVDVSPGESVTATATGLSAKSTVDIETTAAAWDEEIAEIERLSAEQKGGTSVYVYVGIAVGAVVVLVSVALLLVMRSRRDKLGGNAAG